jgi:hypothetical protein
MRILLVTALLIGCGAPVQQAPGAKAPGAASGSGQGTASSQDDDDVNCQNEAPTGSLLQRKVCRDKFERDGDRRDAEQFGHLPRSAPTSGH